MTHDDDPNPLESGYEITGHEESGGSVLPTWIFDLKPLANDPYGFIVGKVRLWLVGGAIAVIEAFTGRVLWMWSEFAAALAAGGDSLGFAFDTGGGLLIDALAVFPELLGNLDALGPLGGVVVGVGGVLLVWVLWQAIERSPSIVWKLYQLIPGT